MSARRRAHHTDTLWIDAILVGMGTQPADGGLAIFDLGGKDRVLAEAIIDRHTDVTLLHIVGYGTLPALIAVSPGASMDADNHGPRMRVLLNRQVEIELLPF